MKNIFKIATLLLAFQVTITNSNAQTASYSRSPKSQKMNNTKSNKVLLVGIDPKELDFTKITFITEKELSESLQTEKQKLINAGYDADWCFVDLGTTAEKTLKDKLSRDEYSLVMIGAGIRTLPDNFILFENLVNVIHKFAPNSQIGFNTNQNDTEISVKRRVKL